MLRNQQTVINVVLLTSVFTMSAICMAVILVLLLGLFDQLIDNKEIFAIIGPAFNTIIGAFVGLLGGISLGRKPQDKGTDAAQAPDGDPSADRDC